MARKNNMNKIQDFAYIVETGKSFDDAVISVLNARHAKSMFW